MMTKLGYEKLNEKYKINRKKKNETSQAKYISDQVYFKK